jgi:hypothetical protein
VMVTRLQMMAAAASFLLSSTDLTKAEQRLTSFLPLQRW